MVRQLSFQARRYVPIPLDDPPMETVEAITLDADKTTLVGLHCWNIGCPDGPPVDPRFCVGMGHRETVELGGRIMSEQIRPALQAARRASILVSHVENDHNGRQHPELMEEVPPEPPVSSPSPPPEPAVPGHREAFVERTHGAGYATDPDSPYVRMDRVDYLMPEPGEPFAIQTPQFDKLLRKRGIENLVYTGFATNMCILHSPGGVADMGALGYRIFIIREATLAVEYPDTIADRAVTRVALRYIETLYGHSIGYDDWTANCERLSLQDVR